MRTPSGERRRRALRWLVPTGVLCVAAAAVVAFALQGADRHPPKTVSPQALLTALRDGGPAGYSGTLVAQMSLDLPVSGDSLSGGVPVLLMAGAHTMRYWYGGTDRQRVAMLGPDSESDVFCTRKAVWQWNSATNVATRSALPPADSAAVGSPVFPAPLTYAALTPQQLAARTVAAVDGSTGVSVTTAGRVADRPTYRLTLRPGAQTATRIAEVQIEVDARHRVALGVQVYARGQSKPSIDVSFTSITYKMPGADYFHFSPPPGATVQQGVRPQLVSRHSRVAAVASEFAPAETGWSAITAFHLTGAGSLSGQTPLRSAMRAVSGKWGSGYLLETPLLSLLVTQDGRVLTGSVDPEVLYTAAG